VLPDDRSESDCKADVLMRELITNTEQPTSKKRIPFFFLARYEVGREGKACMLGAREGEAD
jgi:hypothetical protein